MMIFKFVFLLVVKMRDMGINKKECLASHRIAH